MSVSSIMAGYTFVKLTMDDAELKKGLESAQKKIRSFTDSLNAWSTRMASAAPVLGTAFVGVVRSFAEFDDQMRMVRAFAGATGRELEKLTELAKRLGRETSFTAAQVASGMGELGKSGFSPDEIQSSIRPMMDLARATGTDLAQASTIAANAMRQFRMEAGDAASVADLLVTTANASAVDLADIGESLKMAGTAAASVGEDFRDVVAAIGVLGNMGLKGTMAGTGLRSAYLRIGDDKVWDKIEGKYSIRVETRDAEGNLRKLADIMADLAKEMNQLPTADRLGLAKLLFELEGTPTGLNFTSNIDAIKEFQQQLRNSEGAARKAADTMDSGIGGALRRLSSAAEGFNLALGEALSVSFLPLVETLSKFCDLLRRATTEFSPFIGQAAGAAGLIVGVGAAVKAVMLVKSAVAGVLAPLKTAIFYLDGIVSGTARAAKTATASAAAYTKEAAAQAFAYKVASTYGKALGVLGTKKMFLAAMTRKHAATVLAASTAEIVASKAAAGASLIRRTMYYAEAAGAKVAAAATLGLSKIFTVISAHPVTVALIALVAAYKGLMWATERAAEAQEKEIRMNQRLSQEAADRRKALEKTIQTEDSRMRSLMEMEKKGKLTAQQMFDARTIVAELTEKYGDLGIQFDTLTGQILGTVDAYRKLNASQREALITELEQEAQTAKNSADSIRRGFYARYNWNDKLWSGLSLGSDDDFNLMTQLGFRKERGKWNLVDYDGGATMERMVAARNWADDHGMDEEAQKIQHSIDALKTYAEMQKRIKALREGGQVAQPDENGGAGGMTPEGRRIATAEELEKLQRDLDRMDEDRARRSRTNLENEIVETEKLKKKYRELIQVKLEALQADQERYRRTMEKNKAQSTSQQRDAYDAAYRASVEGRAEMERLTGQRSAADAGYDQQIADAIRREEKLRRDSYRQYDDFLGKLDADEDRERRRRQEEKIYDDAMNQKNFNAARQYVTTLFNTQAEALQLAREKYTRMIENMRSADSDAGTNISDMEAKELDEMQREIKDAAAHAAALQDKINRALEAADEAGVKASSNVIGAWSAEVLNAAVGGGSAADRTASAAERSVKLAQMSLEQQKKQNRKLDDIKNNTKSSSMVYVE